MRRREALLTATITVLSVTIGCTSAGDPPAPDATRSALASDTTAARTEPGPTPAMPSAAPTAPAEAADGSDGESACPVSPRKPPADENGKWFAADVDGDGRPDDIFFLKHPRVGVRTAAGAFSHFEVATAKPFSVLGAEDANGDGRDELFVGLSIAVQVAVFVDCKMRLAHNVDGEPYTFVLSGSGKTRRGMGCVEIDGVRRLVGLAGRELSDTHVRWKRTVVEMDGAHFTNGQVTRGTFKRPRDNPAIRLLGEATCGENRLDAPYGN